MSKPPFLLQSRIEDAILDFFRERGAVILESTINPFEVEPFDAYKLTLAIERVVDETWDELVSAGNLP